MMMTHEEAQELLAVYALNAVDGQERTELEHHVHECVRCSSELDALRGVASAMGNVGEPASQELWDRIAEHLYDDVDADTLPPIRALDLPTAISPLAARRALLPRRAKYGIGVFAVAAAALVSVLSVNLVKADNHVSQLTSALTLASRSVVDAALVTPGHVNVTLSGDHSTGLAKFVLVDGRGYLVSSQMTDLPAGKTYQLWGIFGGKPISIGLMGSAPSTVYFSVEGAKRPSALAITIEPTGGSVTPTSPIVASGTVSA
jgi:hypothetical protein